MSSLYIQVAGGLFFGNELVCKTIGHEFSVVHACKDPCHRKAANYTVKSLPATHPHYLGYEQGRHLYLNLIDPPIPLFQLKSFEMFFAFVDREILERPVLIHCNQGQSRAPSLALLYWGKRMNKFATYKAARNEFEKLCPYKPSKGIETYLTLNWDLLGVAEPRNISST